MQLARRGLEQVRAANHLAHCLSCVIDDHGQIVCRYAVVAAHDEIVDGVAARSEQPVVEGHDGAGGAQPQCRRPAVAPAFGALCGGQLATLPG